MTAGAVFQECLRAVVAAELAEPARRAVVAALEAGRKGPLLFLYEAGAEAGLPRHELLARCAALYFGFCTGNLADDVTDGECTWLDVKHAPTTQYLLHNLWLAQMLRTTVPPSEFAAALGPLTAGASFEIVEVSTETWNAALYRTVAERIAGAQWATYLRLLWHGTALQERARDVGNSAAIAFHVAEDIRSNDRRFFTMPAADQREVRAWGLQHARSAEGAGVVCIALVLGVVMDILVDGKGAHGSP